MDTSARPIVVFRDKPNAQAVNIALDALKKQKRYSDAIALLQPLVDNFASDSFVNARYVEMLVRASAELVRRVLRKRAQRDRATANRVEQCLEVAAAGRGDDPVVHVAVALFDHVEIGPVGVNLANHSLGCLLEWADLHGEHPDGGHGRGVGLGHRAHRGHVDDVVRGENRDLDAAVRHLGE